MFFLLALPAAAVFATEEEGLEEEERPLHVYDIVPQNYDRLKPPKKKSIAKRNPCKVSFYDFFKKEKAPQRSASTPR